MTAVRCATVTARRTVGPGARTALIQAAQADLIADLPGIRLPDLDELRGREVLGRRLAPAPGARRALGDGAAAMSE